MLFLAMAWIYGNWELLSSWQEDQVLSSTDMDAKEPPAIPGAEF